MFENAWLKTSFCVVKFKYSVNDMHFSLYLSFALKSGAARDVLALAG